MKLRRAVFFDRDGTLMREVHYCDSADRVEVFAGAASALETLRRAGWLAVVATNQSGIGRGRFGIAELRDVQSELFRQLDGQLDAVYFCPLAPDGAETPPMREFSAGCACRPSASRKPDPGMLREAARDFGIDLAASFMVGDKEVDLECGAAAGTRTVLVRTGYGAAVNAGAADHVAADVVGAVDWILNETGKEPAHG